MDDVDDIHELALVLVDALDQDIVHSVDSNMDALGLLDVVLELFLARLLHCNELSHEVGVLSIGCKLLDHAHVSDPVVIVLDGF